MTRAAHTFGTVNLEADRFQLVLGTGARAALTLTEQRITDRGRIVTAPWGDITLPMSIWRTIGKPVIAELLDGMTTEERASASSSFKSGVNYLSPLVGRELAVLFWALEEDTTYGYTDQVVAGWRQLAREERWWLYTRASGAEQRSKRGWRRALFYALSDAVDSLPDRESTPIAEHRSRPKLESPGSPKERVRTKGRRLTKTAGPEQRDEEETDPDAPQMPLF